MHHSSSSLTKSSRETANSLPPYSPGKYHSPGFLCFQPNKDSLIIADPNEKTVCREFLSSVLCYSIGKMNFISPGKIQRQCKKSLEGIPHSQR